MGPGPAQGASDFPGLNGPLPAPYLLVYDAEDAECRRLVDWIHKRDRSGLVVAFPAQNTELLRVAPELAGLALDRGIHGYEPRSRVLRSGPRMLPGLLPHLTGWCWLSPVAQVPLLARMLFALILRRA
jgi:hypothetical protein